MEGTVSERQTAFFNVKCSQIAAALLFGKFFSFHNSDPKVVDTLLFGLHYFLAFFWGVVALFFWVRACVLSLFPSFPQVFPAFDLIIFRHLYRLFTGIRFSSQVFVVL